MFVVVKKENSYTNIISIHDNHSDAKSFITNYISAKGIVVNDKSKEGIFVTEDGNTIYEYINTVINITDAGWFINGVKKETKSELVAEYSITKLPECVINKLDQTNKHKQEIDEIIKNNQKEKVDIENKNKNTINDIIESNQQEKINIENKYKKDLDKLTENNQLDMYELETKYEREITNIIEKYKKIKNSIIEQQNNAKNNIDTCENIYHCNLYDPDAIFRTHTSIFTDSMYDDMNTDYHLF